VIIDVLLPTTSNDPRQDVDAAAERMAREMGARFVRGEMVAQLVRLEFAPRVRYRVTADGLRVRDAPSVLMGKIVGRLMRGDVVEVLEESGDWVRHKAGWSAAVFMEKIEK